MQLIKVGNGSPAYHGDFAKKEIELIQANIKGSCIHLFSGKSLIGNVRIDLSCDEATIKGDVFELLPDFIDHKASFNTVIIDPPYNEKFAGKYDKLSSVKGKQFIIFASVEKTTKLFDMIAQLNPQVIIIKSWHYYVPKTMLEEKSSCYVCYAGGYRKPTFLMICRRI